MPPKCRSGRSGPAKANYTPTAPPFLAEASACYYSGRGSLAVTRVEPVPWPSSTATTLGSMTHLRRRVGMAGRSDAVDQGGRLGPTGEPHPGTTPRRLASSTGWRADPPTLDRAQGQATT
jgi:hypothetical protein